MEGDTENTYIIKREYYDNCVGKLGHSMALRNANMWYYILKLGCGYSNEIEKDILDNAPTDSFEYIEFIGKRLMSLGL